METVEVMGDTALSSPCGCKGLPSRSLLSLPTRVSRARPAQQLRTMADGNEVTLSGHTARPSVSMASAMPAGLGQAARGHSAPFFSSLPGLQRGLPGRSHFVPHQERDFSLHGGNPTASTGLPPPPYPSLPPPPAPRPPTCHTAPGNGNAP